VVPVTELPGDIPTGGQPVASKGPIMRLRVKAMAALTLLSGALAVAGLTQATAASAHSTHTHAARAANFFRAGGGPTS
jgi:hypothetical protein